MGLVQQSTLIGFDLKAVEKAQKQVNNKQA